jgi:hypothetical protein
VVGISDGDTLTARCGSPSSYEQVKVRLAAIDAPESHQSYGQRSKQALSSLCYMEQARISPRNLDRYGLTVGSVRWRGEDAGPSPSGRRVDPGSTSSTRPGTTVLGLWADRERQAPSEWRKAQRSG